jgi:uncharacterized protein (DUF983 family)
MRFKHACPHCGELTFGPLHFARTGPFTARRCSACGQLAAPTYATGLLYFVATLLLYGALVVAFLVIEDPLHRSGGMMTLSEALARPTLWVLIIASLIGTICLSLGILRLRQR